MPDEPRFLNDPPPGPDPEARPAAVTVEQVRPAARAVAESLRPDDGEEEDQTSFVVRTGAEWMGHSWDDDPATGRFRRVALGPFTIEVPQAWGEPRLEGDGLAWSLDDVEVVLVAWGGMKRRPTLQGWVDVRRSSCAEGWTVIGGRELPHAFGDAVEVGEVCRVAPRAVRAVRFLFAPPLIVVLSMTAPDTIPDRRGRELAAAFATVQI